MEVSAPTRKRMHADWSLTKKGYPPRCLPGLTGQRHLASNLRCYAILLGHTAVTRSGSHTASAWFKSARDTPGSCVPTLPRALTWHCDIECGVFPKARHSVATHLAVGSARPGYHVWRRPVPPGARDPPSTSVRISCDIRHVLNELWSSPRCEARSNMGTFRKSKRTIPGFPKDATMRRRRDKRRRNHPIRIPGGVWERSRRRLHVNPPPHPPLVARNRKYLRNGGCQETKNTT